MNMREKMARALCFEDGYDPDDDGGIPGVKRWRSYLAMADAALAELEEPTEAMVAAGDEGLADTEYYGRAWGVYRAMIRKARDG